MRMDIGGDAVRSSDVTHCHAICDDEHLLIKSISEEWDVASVHGMLQTLVHLGWHVTAWAGDFSSY